MIPVLYLDESDIIQGNDWICMAYDPSNFSQLAEPIPDKRWQKVGKVAPAFIGKRIQYANKFTMQYVFVRGTLPPLALVECEAYTADVCDYCNGLDTSKECYEVPNG